jgi:hypothetical protein
MILYTEEQVERAIDLAKRNVSKNRIVESLTPIELPSDEEIGEFINTFPYTKHLDDGQFNDGVIYGATIGIDWMRNKIQGGNK